MLEGHKGFRPKQEPLYECDGRKHWGSPRWNNKRKDKGEK